MDENNFRAYEIMDEDLKFVNFTIEDIDWKSIECLPEYMKEQARRLSALFPTFYGFIDAEMNVLVKFQYIGNDRERLKEMRCEAERKSRK